MLTRDGKEHASEVWFPLASVVHSSLFCDLRLTTVIDHEWGWARPCRVTSLATAIDLLPHDHKKLKTYVVNCPCGKELVVTLLDKCGHLGVLAPYSPLTMYALLSARSHAVGKKSTCPSPLVPVIQLECRSYESK